MRSGVYRPAFSTLFDRPLGRLVLCLDGRAIWSELLSRCYAERGSVHTGEGPDYLEAFPELAMREAAGRPLRKRFVTWLDEDNREIGFARITPSDYSLRLQYSLNGPHGEMPERGVSELKIRPVARGLHGYRFAVVCRVCGRDVSALFFRIAHWACQECQGLRHRSTFLPSQLRWQESYNALRYRVGEGRPPGMRTVEYHRMREKMFQLKAKLDGRGRLPGPEFFRLAHAQWSDTDPEDQ